MNLLKTIILITVGIVGLFVATFLTGCANMIDFRNKVIAAENTIIGFEITVPNIADGFTSSLLTLRFGYVTTRYTSAPVGAKASITTDYKDINFWTLSGQVSTKIDVENGVSKTFPEDAPLK